MKKIGGLIVVFSLSLIGCDGNSNDKLVEENETVLYEEHHHSEMEEIILNKGEKWQVDTNMIIHIRKMENEIISFKNLEQKDYNGLANSLQVNIDLLTSNCTMNGAAHDELHKWLLPYIDMVANLSETKNKAEATKYFTNIQNSFTTFNQYFQ